MCNASNHVGGREKNPRNVMKTNYIEKVAILRVPWTGKE